MPEGLDFLGITEQEWSRHICWDIDAAELTRALARLLDAPAILDHASRLLIDLTRRPYTPSSIPEVVDGTASPGNRHLPLSEVRRRIRA